MALIQPFRGLRPNQAEAQKVIAPPYDVINRHDAKKLAHDNPHSFLHIAKAEIDCDEAVSPYDDAVYQMAKKNAAQLIADKILLQDEQPTYYIYQMQMDEKKQTGLVALVSTDAYEANRVRKHEHTRPKKENDRVKLMKTVGGQLSPVLLTYEYNDAVNACFQKAIEKAPLYDQIELDDVMHSLWRIEDADLVDHISTLFESMPNIYMADGHHRSAAATRVANEDKNNHPCQYFLSVLMPDNEMTILGYHRLIRDWQNLSPDALLEKLSNEFLLAEKKSAVIPSQPGIFGLYMEGQWYQLTLKNADNNEDTIANLDVTHLHRKIIEPFFDITDPRSDERIDFIGGLDAAKKLMASVDAGEAAMAFTLPATSMHQLMSVAAKGGVMPPKSTWFEPKLADGLISYLFD